MRRSSAVLGVVLLLLFVAPRALANELITPEKLTNLTWSYSLTSKALKIKACGRFRPGENDQCATAVLRENAKDGRAIDRTLQMLRLPRDKLGIVLNIGPGNAFEIAGITAELLSAPGIGERPAKPPTVELSGESLSQVLWIQLLATRTVTIKVCGKVANPDKTGCAEHIEESQTGVRRLRDLLLLNPVEQLGFLVGWDGTGFTKLRRIASPTTN